MIIYILLLKKYNKNFLFYNLSIFKFIYLLFSIIIIEIIYILLRWKVFLLLLHSEKINVFNLITCFKTIKKLDLLFI